MILAVAGSGRRMGNSARLLRQALPAEASSVVELSELTFRGCVGCGACRSTADACVLQDDLTPVLAAAAAADAVALAAPLYYGYPSGLFKSFLDRWYSFRDGQRRLRVREGRPALLILTQGHPDPNAYSWTVESLRKVLTAFGFEPQILVAPGLEDSEAADRTPALLAEARRMGAHLQAQGEGTLHGR